MDHENERMVTAESYAEEYKIFLNWSYTFAKHVPFKTSQLKTFGGKASDCGDLVGKAFMIMYCTIMYEGDF